jgi:hypothetical protein
MFNFAEDMYNAAKGEPMSRLSTGEPNYNPDLNTRSALFTAARTAGVPIALYNPGRQERMTMAREKSTYAADLRRRVQKNKWEANNPR